MHLRVGKRGGRNRSNRAQGKEGEREESGGSGELEGERERWGIYTRERGIELLNSHHNNIIKFGLVSIPDPGSNKEALAVAHASGADFIRVEGFVFSHIGDEGWRDSCAGELLRYRKMIDAERVMVFTDIKKKHS